MTASSARSQRAAIVAIVRETWSEILGHDVAGADSDFFEIGGHSLVVAAAIARLNDRLGLALEPRAIFAAPTPAEMAALILHRANPPAESPNGGTTPFVPDWVVPLQRAGNERPVFVFPAGHDELHALAKDAQIAALVGRDHPFWGFRHDDPAVADRGASEVATVAAAYVRQMRAIQGSGPFFLFGNCAGGYFAWETARQLLASGESVAGILFYEVPLRADFDALPQGQSPAHRPPARRLTRTYHPAALPLRLTHLMTAAWHARGWWAPWQRVARGGQETLLLPDNTLGPREFRARREALIAEQVRRWIARAEPPAGRP